MLALTDWDIWDIILTERCFQQTEYSNCPMLRCQLSIPGPSLLCSPYACCAILILRWVLVSFLSASNSSLLCCFIITFPAAGAACNGASCVLSITNVLSMFYATISCIWLEWNSHTFKVYLLHLHHSISDKIRCLASIWVKWYF